MDASRGLPGSLTAEFYDILHEEVDLSDGFFKNLHISLLVPALILKKRKRKQTGAPGSCLLAASIPFCAVVLATEYSHFFVVKKRSSSKCSPLRVIDVAADILC